MECWSRGTSASPTTDLVLLMPRGAPLAPLFRPSYRPFLSPLGCGSGIPTSFEILLCPVAPLSKWPLLGCWALGEASEVVPSGWGRVGLSRGIAHSQPATCICMAFLHVSHAGRSQGRGSDMGWGSPLTGTL